MFPFIALIFYLILNVTAITIYAMDKAAARMRRWRTQETILLGMSLIGGAFGGLLAMMLFHHKTRKPIFWIVNVLSAAGHILIIRQLVTDLML